MLSFRALSLAAPLALVAMSSAQTVLLRFKPPVGTKVEYVLTSSMSMGMPTSPKPMAFSQTVPMSYRVVSRTGALTTLETKMGQVKVDAPAGSPIAANKAMMEKQSSGMTSTTTVDEFGNLKGMATGGAAAAAMAGRFGNGMMAGAQGISYPKQALKVGDTWSGSLDMGKMMGAGPGGGMGMKATGKIPIVYKLVGIEKRGAKTLAKIALTMKGNTTMTMASPGAAPSGGKGMTIVMGMNTSGIVVLDTATGLVQSMSNTSDTTTAFMGQNMKQHMVMTMKVK